MNPTMEPAGFPASLPENFEMAVHLTRPEIDHHLRLMAALKMFELGQISSGKAAELVGMTRVDFLHTCGRYRVSIFNYPPDEAEAEILRELEAISQLPAK
jgi:predicted HTH domain antitoxin